MNKESWEFEEVFNSQQTGHQLIIVPENKELFAVGVGIVETRLSNQLASDINQIYADAGMFQNFGFLVYGEPFVMQDGGPLFQVVAVYVKAQGVVTQKERENIYELINLQSSIDSESVPLLEELMKTHPEAADLVKVESTETNLSKQPSVKGPDPKVNLSDIPALSPATPEEVLSEAAKESLFDSDGVVISGQVSANSILKLAIEKWGNIHEPRRKWFIENQGATEKGSWKSAGIPSFGMKKDDVISGVKLLYPNISYDEKKGKGGSFVVEETAQSAAESGKEVVEVPEKVVAPEQLQVAKKEEPQKPADAPDQGVTKVSPIVSRFRRQSSAPVTPPEPAKVGGDFVAPLKRPEVPPAAQQSTQQQVQLPVETVQAEPAKAQSTSEKPLFNIHLITNGVKDPNLLKNTKTGVPLVFGSMSTATEHVESLSRQFQLMGMTVDLKFEIVNLVKEKPVVYTFKFIHNLSETNPSLDETSQPGHVIIRKGSDDAERPLNSIGFLNLINFVHNAIIYHSKDPAIEMASKIKCYEGEDVVNITSDEAFNVLEILKSRLHRTVDALGLGSVYHNLVSSWFEVTVKAESFGAK